MSTLPYYWSHQWALHADTHSTWSLADPHYLYHCNEWNVRNAVNGWTTVGPCLTIPANGMYMCSLMCAQRASTTMQHWQDQLTGRRFLGGSCISHRLHVERNRRWQHTPVYIAYSSILHMCKILTCFDRFAGGWEEENLPFLSEAGEWMEMYSLL